MNKERKNELIAEGLKLAESMRRYFLSAGDSADGIKPLHEYLDATVELTKEEQEAFDIGYLYRGSETEAREFKAWSQGYFDGYVACRQEMKADLSKNA
jgi:hypothetical protein